MIRKTERILRSGNGDPCNILYNEGADELIMQRGNPDGAGVTIGTTKVCTLNSTDAQLAGGATFTGTGVDIDGYATILVTVFSDQASATDGLVIQFSHDNTDWHNADEYTYVANSYKTYSFQPVDQYYRIKYTNGAVDTTTFHISTRFHSSNVKSSSHRMADDIKGQDDAELVKAILAAEKAGTGDVYTNIQSTAGGNLKVSAEEFDASAILYQNRPYLENELNNTWYPQEMDGSAGALTTIDEEHHKVHVGMHFYVQDYVDLAINNVYDLQFTTNAWATTTEEIHLTWHIGTENETLWHIYEGATIEVAGTTIAPINNQRNSANTSVCTLAGISNTSLANANADTIVSGATLLAQGISGSGRDAGEAGRGNELVLKQNTIYCMRAVATAAGYVNFHLEWYEHAPHVANNWINSPVGTV